MSANSILQGSTKSLTLDEDTLTIHPIQALSQQTGFLFNRQPLMRTLNQIKKGVNADSVLWRSFPALCARHPTAYMASQESYHTANYSSHSGTLDHQCCDRPPSAAVKVSNISIPRPALEVPYIKSTAYHIPSP